MCANPDKISALEAKTHGFKQCNVNGYGIDLKFNLTKCKLTVAVRYSCVSVLDEDKYKNIILQQDELEQRPQGNADSVLGQNVCYDYNETVIEGGTFCHEGKMYVIVIDFCGNDVLVRCKITEGDNVGKIVSYQYNKFTIMS